MVIVPVVLIVPDPAFKLPTVAPPAIDSVPEPVAVIAPVVVIVPDPASKLATVAAPATFSRSPIQTAPVIPTPPPTFSAPVKVLEDEVSFEIYTADAIVIVPPTAPTLIEVAAPPTLSVVAVVFHKVCVVVVPAIVDDAIVIVPLLAPTLIEVADAPTLSVVATVFHKVCVAVVPAIIDDLIVIVPLLAPTLIEVAAPPTLSVVEFVFIKLNAVLVLFVVKSPETLIPPPTAKVFPIPTPPVTTRAPSVLEVVSLGSFIVTGQYPAEIATYVAPPPVSYPLYFCVPPKIIGPLFT